MLGTRVALGRVAHAGVVHCLIERLNVLRGHARVLIGVTPIDVRADTGREQVGALLGVGDHAAGVKAGDRCDALRVCSGDHPADPRTEAITGDPDRTGGELPELVQICATVRGKRRRV